MDRLEEIEVSLASCHTVPEWADSYCDPLDEIDGQNHVEWLIAEVRRLRRREQQLQRDADLGARIRHIVETEGGAG